MLDRHLLKAGDPILTIRHRSGLVTSSFQGVEETLLLVRPPLEHPNAYGHSQGFGDFNYLADGLLKPQDGMPMHGHANTDIVTVVLQGAVHHRGTLGDGIEVAAPGVIVQRAGTGMQHAELNIHSTASRFIQMWFTPPKKNMQPDLRLYPICDGEMANVLGAAEDDDVLASPMCCSVGALPRGHRFSVNGAFSLYLADGSITANGVLLNEPSLIEGDILSATIQTPATCILVTKNQKFSETR